MTDFPRDFMADLRRLKPWPAMEDSPWRQPYLADLTYGEIYRLVNASVPGRPSRILDIGCGSGYLSLELARQGHRVVGVDQDRQMIAIARKTKEEDLDGSKGRLVYRVEDFQRWSRTGREFDVVIFCRALHHMTPDLALGKAHKVLRKGGRIVCVEYAHDQFDRRTAIWLYHIRRTLEMSGWYAPSEELPHDPGEAIDRIAEEWMGYGEEHGLRRYEEMRRPLEQLFRREHLSWHPYIHWDIISGMRIPPGDVDRAFANFLVGMEDHLIETGRIRPTLFRFVGVNRE